MMIDPIWAWVSLFLYTLAFGVYCWNCDREDKKAIKQEIEAFRHMMEYREVSLQNWLSHIDNPKLRETVMQKVREND